MPLRFTVRAFFVLLVVITLFYGCRRSDEARTAVVQPSAVKSVETQERLPPATTARPLFLSQALTAVLVEEQADALPLWHGLRAEKPALLIFSAKTLRPLPQHVAPEIDRLLGKNSQAELQRRIARPVADLLLASDLGVAAAMQRGYFSRVIWVVPLEDDAVLLPLDDFKKGMLERAAGWGGEIDSFKNAWDGTFTGRLDGITVDVVTIDRLPKLQGPVVIHLDGGFFKSYYSNEVKKSLFSVLQDLLGKVAQRQYQPLAVTISHDNLSYELPLTMRFLARDLASIISDPSILIQGTPRMKLRGQQAYLDSFYQPEMILERARELVKIGPQDADAHYSLYRALRQGRQQEQALLALEQAVKLDPVYADEYIELINLALEDKNYNSALSLVEKALRAVPDNPFVRYRKAQLLAEAGRGKESYAILQDLRTLPWSTFYYPRIQEDIDRLQLEISQQ